MSSHPFVTFIVHFGLIDVLYLRDDHPDGVFELLPDGLLDEGRLRKPAHEEHVADAKAAAAVVAEAAALNIDGVVVVAVRSMGEDPVDVLEQEEK